MNTNPLRNKLSKMGQQSITIILLVLITLTSCTKQQVNPPDFAIPIDTLKMVLIDIHLADAYLSVKRTDELGINKEELYRGILDFYDVDKKRFDTTIHYYAVHPDIYEAVYENIMNDISTLEAQMLSDEQSRKQALKDSLTYRRTVNENDTTEQAVSNEFLDKVKEAKERKLNKENAAKEKDGLMKTPIRKNRLKQATSTL